MNRWARRGWFGAVALFAVAAATLHLAASNLARPWIKARVQALARSRVGIDVDYAGARVRWLSGFEAEDVVVRSPADLRGVAPDLLRIGRVRVRWSPACLWGHRPRIERIEISDAALTVVVDDNGRTSFDALARPSPAAAPAAAPVPISRLAGEMLGRTPPVGQIDVARASVTLVRTVEGRVRERDSIQGLGITLAAAPDAGGWRVRADIGAPGDPLDVHVARERGGATAEARLLPSVTADLTAQALSVAADLRVAGQSFVPELGGDPGVAGEDWVRLVAGARFEPDAGRTVATISRFDAAGGAATAQAEVDVPDVGDPVVRHAHGDVDLGRLLAWAPEGLWPVHAERAVVHFTVDALCGGQLADGGQISLDADLSKVKGVSASGSIAVDGAQIALYARPAPGSQRAASGSIHVEGARVEDGSRADLKDLAVDFDARQSQDGTLAGHAAVRVAQAVLSTAAGVTTDVRGASLQARVAGLAFDGAEPAASRGDVSLSASLASLDVRSSAAHVAADGVSLRGHAHLEGQAPYGLELTQTAARLRVVGSGSRLLADGPARVALAAHDVWPDRRRPIASRGVLHAAVELGAVRAVLDATKTPDTVDYALGASASSLKAARPFLPPAAAQAAPWDAMAVDVRSRGRACGLSGRSPELSEQTDVRVDRPAFGGLAARSATLTLHSKGTAWRHQVNADLRVLGLALQGAGTSDDRVVLSALLDRTKPSAQLDLRTQGLASAALSASLSFDRVRRALDYDLHGRLGDLAPLAALASRTHGLQGLDVSKLQVDARARGTLLGVVGALGLEPDPLRTAAGDVTAQVQASGVRWSRGDLAIDTPAVEWHTEARSSDGRLTAISRLDAEAVRGALGRHSVRLGGISEEASAQMTGDPSNPSVDVTQHMTVRTVQQDLAPGYPVGGVDFSFSVSRDASSLVRISGLQLRNRAGGTSLSMQGGVQAGPGRHHLSTTADLEQDMALLSDAPSRLAGGGHLELSARIESVDLSTFRARTDLKASGVRVQIPKAGVRVESIDGDVPIEVTFEVGDKGFSIRHDTRLNPYSSLRFADQHPLLSHGGYISVGRIETPWATIAPLVGSLGVEQNVVTLRQFEMGLRGGRVTGECALDWDGAASTLQMHVRASGVQSSHGEPFDGNIAVVVSAADRSVEGRAEILRIGPRHLLDLLDMQDPMHVDPEMNWIRKLLAFGYPDRVRLVFDHGFASARIELGGLASLARIGEIRGIPMGPIIDKFLSPEPASEATP